MAKGLVESKNLKDIADAIREVGKDNNTYTVAQMPEAIKKIKGKVYKRYISAGEDLSGKKIIFNYDSNYKDYLDLYDNQHAEKGQFIMVGLNDIKYFRNYGPGDHDDSDYAKVYDKYVLKGLNGEDIYVYNPTTGEEEVVYLGALYHGDDLKIYISPISQVWAYQHLMLEDENIRPIKVGDHFISGTVLYEITNNTIINSITEVKGELDASNLYNCDIATFSNGGRIYCTSGFEFEAPTYRGFLTEDATGSSQLSLFVACGLEWRTGIDGEDHTAKVTVTKDMGKITNINDDGLNWSQYFLVDTTTLGE